MTIVNNNLLISFKINKIVVGLFVIQIINASGDEYSIPHDVINMYCMPVSKQLMYLINIYIYYIPQQLKVKIKTKQNSLLSLQ